MMERFRALALLCLLGCHRDEPVIDGEPMSHWEHEAKQVSFFTFWNSDKDERRHVAFRNLTELGAPAVPTLVRLLERDSRSVSGDALNALCALGPRAGGAVPDLMKMLSADAVEARRSAAMILGCIGPAASPAIPALTALFGSRDQNTVRVAAMALGRIGGDAHRSLGAAMQHAAPEVRQSALMGLAQAGMDTARVLEYADKALADKSPEVRARGVEMLLTQRGTARGEHLGLLVQAMRDSSPVVREAADRVYTHAAQRGGSPRVLAAALRNGDAGTRADAAWRLSLLLDDPVDRSRLSADDFERAQAALANARHDSERTVRIYVVRGLAAAGKLPKPMLIARLRHDLPNAPADIQVRGASVLWTLTHRVDDVKSFYLAGLASDDRWIRLEALREIMKMRSGARPLASAIEKLRDDPDRDVRERASRTLTLIAGVAEVR
jgi:HEAT repeat protein